MADDIAPRHIYQRTGILKLLLPFLITAVTLPGPAAAWDEKGHVMVTELAVKLLPDDMPLFVRDADAVARLAYLSGEPDRWRNLKDLPMGQLNQPDHYFDIDLLPLYELTPATLPPLRYDYLAAIHAYKLAHPEKDYGYDRARDREHAHEWPGFAPYEVSELFVLLRSSWRTLNTYERYADVAGAATISAARANVLHHMGIMSHYVGDLAQPMHTTKHHHGWVGENPNRFSTDYELHQRIDGGFIKDAEISLESCGSRNPVRFTGLTVDNVFTETVAYTERSFALVEPLYILERDGAFDRESPKFEEGKKFIEERLSIAAGFLAALWEAAYRDAGIDEFRERRLQSIREKEQAAPAQPAM